MIEPRKNIESKATASEMPYWSKKGVSYNSSYEAPTIIYPMRFLKSAVKDSTEQKKAEERLFEEKTFSDFIINRFTGIFYVLDGNGRFLRWNKNLETVLGYSGDEISKMSAIEFFDDEEKETIAQKIKEVFTKGEAQVEAKLVTKNKNRISYKFDASAAQFDGTTLLIGIGVGVTEPKKPGATITESEGITAIEGKYRSFFENSIDAYLVTDDKGQVLEVNAAAEQLFGKNRSEICAGGLSNLIAHSGASEELLKELLETGRSRGELTMLEKDGAQFPGEIAAQTYNDGKGKRIALTVRDISNRSMSVEGKQIQNERELLIRELMKDNADLKQFSFIASHNLRAPVSNIMGLLELIDCSLLDQDNKEMFEMLKESARQLTATIEDLSNILVIKNSNNVEVSSINIEDLYKEVHLIFLSQLENIKADIITDFKISEISFHKTYLESVFINLISNAIKYRSPDRILNLHISTSRNTSGHCILTFRDNGIGIDLKKYKNKVFGLYQRFNDEIDGHGLGLFIIKTQINALGGRIEVESEVGRGTTFTITFAPDTQI